MPRMTRMWKVSVKKYKWQVTRVRSKNGKNGKNMIKIW